MSTLQETTEQLRNDILGLSVFDDIRMYKYAEREIDILIRNALINFGVAVMIDSDVRKEIDNYCEEERS